jgi:hypothetical protein
LFLIKLEPPPVIHPESLNTGVKGRRGIFDLILILKLNFKIKSK